MSRRALCFDWGPVGSHTGPRRYYRIFSLICRMFGAFSYDELRGFESIHLQGPGTVAHCMVSGNADKITRKYP